MKKSIEIQYQECSLKELDDLQLEIVNQAKSATSKSYAPYSQFNVGCAILLQSGEIVCGSNMENAAYSSTICAERTALGSINNLNTDAVILKIAIAYKYGDTINEKILSPCGECRQVISEFASRQTVPIEIILFTNDDKIIIIENSDYLLPFSFGKKNLEK